MMYDLHRLGWHGFQQLCLTVSREILGQTVESFLDANDGGRDGAFEGMWSPTAQETLEGRFVIQCKFTGKAGYNISVSDLEEEATKARRLVEEGRCHCYVLMTNAGISGRQAEEIERLFKGVGVKHLRLFGATWICEQILANKRLRMLVPRIYGLGDLSQILDERAYSQARALLESLQEDLSKVVITGAYSRAATALDKHGFVLLVGEPAAGKTTIASLLAMGALDQWNASTLKLDDPGKVIEHWNPDEPSQFFWIDDAFGVTQYESHLVQDWNHILPQIKTMLRRGARIVMTSRDYIYNRARRDLKEGAFPLLQESQVVIDVHELTPGEKRQILYNHLKLGRQPPAFRSDIKPYLELVAAHSRFVPEIARRLSDPLFTQELHLSAYSLGQFVDKQERFLQEVLQGLDNDSKAALALIYMRNGALAGPIELSSSESRAIERLGSTLGGCTSALDAMNHSLVRHSSADDSTWHFKHPTVGDAYAALLARNPELIGIYAQGSSAMRLIDQVTCGDVGVEGAVVIPRSLFPLMLEKLQEIGPTGRYKSASFSSWETNSRLQRFLSWRCSGEFLRLFVEKHPGILDKVSRPGLFLSAVSEVDLAARLHEFGLLPEDRRKVFVETVTDYAVDGEDEYAFESAKIRSILTSDEVNELRDRVYGELLPRLSDVRLNWQVDRSSDGSAEEHMQPLVDSFEILQRNFSGDPEVVTAISREIRLAHEWIAEHSEDSAQEMPRPRLGEVASSESSQDGRSIFDDIDE